MKDFLTNNKLLITVLALVVLVLLVSLVVRLLSPTSEIEKEILPTPTPSIPGRTTEPLHLEDDPIIKLKPWIAQLPIKDPYYFVEYKFEKDVISALLYPTTSRTIPKEDQVEFLKKEVAKKLTQLGVNLDKERVEWQIK
jgi:hypothetical protein